MNVPEDTWRTANSSNPTSPASHPPQLPSEGGGQVLTAGIVNYGLQLQEKPLQRIEAADTGDRHSSSDGDTFLEELNRTVTEQSDIPQDGATSEREVMDPETAREIKSSEIGGEQWQP